MSTGRNVRGVLANFLSTYTSRDSDVHGYWLFGLIVDNLDDVRIDLLAPVVPTPDDAMAFAVALASAKFQEQLEKAGLGRTQMREAWLMVHREPVSVVGVVNGHARAGYNVRFTASALLAGGRRRHEHERVVFVAPHDPAAEHRSARAP